MRQYKISPEFLRSVGKKAVVKSIPVVLIVVAAGMAMSVLSSDDKGGMMDVMPIVGVFVAILIPIGFFIGIKRSKALLESYTITFSENLVTREQLATPAISIYFNEIRDIEKGPDGQYSIYGKDAGDIIFISPHIERYDEVSELLAGIRMVQTKSAKNLLDQYPKLYALVYLGLMFCAFVATNKILIVTSSAIFVGLSFWNFYTIQSGKNVDEKTKRNMWFTLLPTFAVLAKAVMTLLGFQQS